MALRWLFEPARHASEAGRSFMLAQLLSSPLAPLMGSICSLMVLAVAVHRTRDPIYVTLFVLEIVVITARLLEWRGRERHIRRLLQHEDVAEISINIDVTTLLSVLWCALQGAIAFTSMRGDDPVLRVLSATLIMAILGPICARNYAAPRFAMLLVLLCNIPFVAGAVLSNEPWLSVTVLLTPPFLYGAFMIISTFHNAMLVTLEAKEENARLARHDSLTGILNRQGMDEKLSHFAASSGRTMALLSIDLDGFKQVNDTHGHGAGDMVLIEVARRIGTIVRGTDLVARMGGDEFMVILRNMPPQEIGAFAERLIGAIANDSIPLSNDVTARVGASIGYACLPEDATTTLELRLKADQALYVAKVAGKGTCRRFGDRSSTGIAAINAQLQRAYSK